MNENRILLFEGARSIGVDLDERQLDQFEKYFELLVEWNERVNLTAITDEKSVVQKHFLDSLLIAEKMDISRLNTLIDIGTGAGFPGVPLKIAFPHLKVTLLDTLNKRILFLETVVSELGLQDVNCVHGRAEDAAKDKDMRETYDLAVSRAVSKLNVLYEYCIPFVKLEGVFVAYKSTETELEIEEGSNAIEILGGKPAKVMDAAIPNTEIERRFVVVEKLTSTPDKYPRKAGKPAKSPL